MAEITAQLPRPGPKLDPYGNNGFPTYWKRKRHKFLQLLFVFEEIRLLGQLLDRSMFPDSDFVLSKRICLGSMRLRSISLRLNSGCLDSDLSKERFYNLITKKPHKHTEITPEHSKRRQKQENTLTNKEVVEKNATNAPTVEPSVFGNNAKSKKMH